MNVTEGLLQLIPVVGSRKTGMNKDQSKCWLWNDQSDTSTRTQAAIGSGDVKE